MNQEITKKHTYLVSHEETGQRIDIFLKEKMGLSRAKISVLFSEQQIQINGKKVNKGVHVQAGETIDCYSEIDVLRKKITPEANTEIPLDVIYEDRNIVVINKQPGISVHPLSFKDARETLASALISRFPSCKEASTDFREGGFCHRLDIGTSGVIIAAKSREIYLELREAFRKHTIHKEYLALCCGKISSMYGTVKGGIINIDKRVKIVDLDRKHALFSETIYHVEKQGHFFSLILASTFTGRRHQIRVHMASINSPLVGDLLYGGKSVSNQFLEGYHPKEQEEISGPLLHAYRITLPPLSFCKEGMFFEAPLSKTRKQVFQQLLKIKDPKEYKSLIDV